MTGCADCRYFVETSRQHPNYPNNSYITQAVPDAGRCSRDPVWLNVRDRHFCGSFSPKYPRQGKLERDEGQDWRERYEYWEKRGREAERKLKKANERARKVRATPKSSTP